MANMKKFSDYTGTTIELTFFDAIKNASGIDPIDVGTMASE